MVERLNRKDLVSKFSDVVKQEVINKEKSIEEAYLRIKKIEENISSFKNKIEERVDNFESLVQKSSSTLIGQIEFFNKKVKTYEGYFEIIFKGQKDTSGAIDKLHYKNSKQKDFSDRVDNLFGFCRSVQEEGKLCFFQLENNLESKFEEFDKSLITLEENLRTEFGETPPALERCRIEIFEKIKFFQQSLNVLEERVIDFSKVFSKLEKKIEFILNTEYDKKFKTKKEEKKL